MLFDRPRTPPVLSARSFAIALGLHLAVIGSLWLVAVFRGWFHKEDEIIPIDLTVVINENPDGKENDPPPLKNPEPPKPKPKPPPQPKPRPAEQEKPKALEQIVTNVVSKAETKKPEKPKPEKPKKSAKELREERIKKMRAMGKVVNTTKVTYEVKNAKESGNGRTERRPADWKKLLDQGYRPGSTTQLATSVKQRCLMLIQRALEERWESLSPSVGQSGVVHLSVQFTSTGGMTNVRLVKSCGDKVSDAAALSVARSVNFIQGLDPEFVAGFRNEPLTIRYEVRGKQ